MSSGTSAESGQVRVLAVGAVAHPLRDIVAQPGGAALDVSFDTAGAVRALVEDGALGDLIITVAEDLDWFAETGAIEPSSRFEIGTMKLGMAVRTGADAPDVTSTAALARAIEGHVCAYADPASGATTGVHLAQRFQALEVSAEALDRAVLGAGGRAAVAAVAEGRADFAFTVVSEILGTPGVELAGELPESCQLLSLYAGAARSGQSGTNVDAAIAFLTAIPARDVFTRFGFRSNASSVH